MFETTKDLGWGGAHQNTRLAKVVAELQGLTITGPLDGATANTAIAVTGIETEDTVVKGLVLTAPPDNTKITGPIAGVAAAADLVVAGLAEADTLLKVLIFTAGVPSDDTANCTIKEGGGAINTTTDTTGNLVLVFWAKAATAVESELDLTKLTIVDRRASGTLTVADGIADGDKVVVNGKTYTFKTITVTPSTNVGPQIVPITLTDENGAADALAKAIMSADSNVTCEVTDNVVTIYWRVAGVVGNTKTLSAADSNAHVTASGETLAGGTATNAVKIDADTSGKKLILFWFNKQ